jgi:hypothetical protein
LKVRLTSQTHEWRSRDEEGTVHIIRAEWDSRQWHFLTTTKKDPEWHDVTAPTLQHFEQLRDVLMRKYQRNRNSWSYVEHIDKIIASMKAPPSADP